MSFNMPKLSTEQKLSFINNGFVKIDQVVPQVFINRALRAINHSLGQGRDSDNIEILNQRSWCPELGGTEVITDLFNKTPAFNLAEDLIGKGKVEHCGGGQVPPRFPQALDKDESNVKQFGGHIDGIGNGTNGIPSGEYRRGFTALCVILLSNLPEEYMGNFTVWPGSHYKVHEYIKKHGHDILKEGSPPVSTLEEARPCIGEAGDVIFAHHQTLHSAFPNLSPFIRYAAIFRVRHFDVEKNGCATYDDLWLEFDGLQEILEGELTSNR